MASNAPSLIVPPKSLSIPLFTNWSSLAHSVIKPTTDELVSPNSLELASSIFNIFLTASMAASCMPKQIPKYGILFSRAYLIAKILPSEPLLPNPPGTSIPSD